MDRKRLEEIMEGDSNLGNYPNEDNAFLGLLIIRKYIPGCGIEGAEHDLIYSAGVDELLEAGLTEEDAIELRNLNWMIEYNSLACFV